MILAPQSLDELKRALAEANQTGRKVGAVSLEALTRLIDHTPEDMTATAEAGMKLGDFQAELRRRGQWLPVDPPDGRALTIGALLEQNASGPRQFGHGTVRDHLIGMQVVLADGRLIKSGGKVVKNVAGYDLCKLFIGSRGTLGVIVEATFKLKPLPEAEEFVQAHFDSMGEVSALLEAVASSELDPVVLDLHNVSPGPPGQPARFTVVAGFAGAREDVDYQKAKAKELGAAAPSSLEYEQRFWGDAPGEAVRRCSVLPSDVPACVARLNPASFVARAGNGVVFYRGGGEPPHAELPLKLAQRVKAVFDPNYIFPELPL